MPEVRFEFLCISGKREVGDDDADPNGSSYWLTLSVESPRDQADAVELSLESFDSDDGARASMSVSLSRHDIEAMRDFMDYLLRHIVT